MGNRKKFINAALIAAVSLGVVFSLSALLVGLGSFDSKVAEALKQTVGPSTPDLSWEEIQVDFMAGSASATNVTATRNSPQGVTRFRAPRIDFQFSPKQILIGSCPITRLTVFEPLLEVTLPSALPSDERRIEQTCTLAQVVVRGGKARVASLKDGALTQKAYEEIFLTADQVDPGRLETILERARQSQWRSASDDLAFRWSQDGVTRTFFVKGVNLVKLQKLAGDEEPLRLLSGRVDVILRFNEAKAAPANIHMANVEIDTLPRFLKERYRGMPMRSVVRFVTDREGSFSFDSAPPDWLRSSLMSPYDDSNQLWEFLAKQFVEQVRVFEPSEYHDEGTRELRERLEQDDDANRPPPSAF
jgi:hypothetical protein